MENKNIETVAVPVGTVRKFVSEQYLAQYKTNTLDTQYATKDVATTSRNGLMSKEDKEKLDTVIDDKKQSLTTTWSSDKILKKIEQESANIQFSITIPASSWTTDGSLVSNTVTHNMNKKILYIGAYDNVTKESLFISYKIENNNVVKLSIEEPLETVITIVFEGNLINLAGGDIEDSKTTLTSTWSSSKIESVLPKLATNDSDGLISKSEKVLLAKLPQVEQNVNSLQSSKLDKSCITFSTEEPSGGSHGDIWFKYEK